MHQIKSRLAFPKTHSHSLRMAVFASYIVAGTFQIEAQSSRQEGNRTQIVKVLQAPVIDGKLDSMWLTAPYNPIDNPISGKRDDSLDCSGGWRGIWTATHVGIFVNIRDDKKLMDSPGHTYLDDQIEMFFTSDGKIPAKYFSTPNTFAYENPRGGPSIETHKGTKGWKSAFGDSTNGWTVELWIPFSDWKVTRKIGDSIGIDMNINDDDDASDKGARDYQAGWNGKVCCVGRDIDLQGFADFVDIPVTLAENSLGPRRLQQGSRMNALTQIKDFKIFWHRILGRALPLNLPPPSR